MSKWVNATAKDVVTISGSTWNANTRTVAGAVNYNAQILKDALSRIEELEKAIKHEPKPGRKSEFCPFCGNRMT